MDLKIDSFHVIHFLAFYSLFTPFWIILIGIITGMGQTFDWLFIINNLVLIMLIFLPPAVLALAFVIIMEIQKDNKRGT